MSLKFHGVFRSEDQLPCAAPGKTVASHAKGKAGPHEVVFRICLAGAVCFAIAFASYGVGHIFGEAAKPLGL